MTVSELVYFDGFDESKKGLSRGFVAFVPLWFSLFFASFLIRTTIPLPVLDRVLVISTVSLVICSMIGVQKSKSNKESLQYGALSGFCVSIVSVIYLYLLERRLGYESLVFIVFMSFLCSIVSAITRYISSEYSLY